jgi:hypothetical protein
MVERHLQVELRLVLNMMLTRMEMGNKTIMMDGESSRVRVVQNKAKILQAPNPNPPRLNPPPPNKPNANAKTQLNGKLRKQRKRLQKLTA